MTLEEFQALRAFQDRRVRMNFSDGQVVIATLVSITSDFDESRHIVIRQFIVPAKRVFGKFLSAMGRRSSRTIV